MLWLEIQCGKPRMISMYEACGFSEPALDLLKDIDHICRWRVWLSQSHPRTFQPLLMEAISALLRQRCHGASPCQLAGDDCYGFCELVFVTLET